MKMCNNKKQQYVSTLFYVKPLSSCERNLDELPVKFMSHDFIQKFTQRYQHEYIDFLRHQSLNNPGNPNPFKEIHAQMARFLSHEQSNLNIAQQGKGKSINIFGAYTPNEKWEKIR